MRSQSYPLVFHTFSGKKRPSLLEDVFPHGKLIHHLDREVDRFCAGHGGCTMVELHLLILRQRHEVLVRPRPQPALHLRRCRMALLAFALAIRLGRESDINHLAPTPAVAAKRGQQVEVDGRTGLMSQMSGKAGGGGRSCH